MLTRMLLHADTHVEAAAGKHKAPWLLGDESQPAGRGEHKRLASCLPISW